MKEPVTKPHFLLFHLYEVSRTGSSNDTESRFVVAQDGGAWEDWRVNANGYRAFFFGMIKLF